MNLQDLGNLGELIGGIAVIVSLLYLAVQIRHAGVLASASAHRDLTQAVSDILTDIIRQPELYRIWQAGLFTEEPMSDEDRDKLGMLLYQIFGVIRTGFHSAELDPAIDEYSRITLDRFLSMPRVRDWWSRQRVAFPTRFRDAVDRRIAGIKDGSVDVSRFVSAGSGQPL